MSVKTFEASNGAIAVNAQSNGAFSNLSFRITTNDNTTISFGLADVTVKPNEPTKIDELTGSIGSARTDEPTKSAEPTKSVEPTGYIEPTKSDELTKSDTPITKKTKHKYTIGDPIMAIYDNGEIIVRDLATNKEVRKIKNINEIFAIGISADNISIISCYNDGSVIIHNPNVFYSQYIRDARDARSVAKLTSFVVSPDRKTVTVAIGYSNGFVSLIRQNSEINTFAGNNNPVSHLSFSSDGRYLFIGSNCIDVLDTSNFTLTKQIRNHSIQKARLSNDAKTIYCLLRGQFTICDCDSTNFEITSSNGIGKSDKNDFVVSPDETFIVTYADDKIVVWKKTARGYISPYQFCRSYILDVFFAPISQKIVIRTKSGIYQYEMNTNDKINAEEKICSVTTDSLLAVSKN